MLAVGRELPGAASDAPVVVPDREAVRLRVERRGNCTGAPRRGTDRRRPCASAKKKSAFGRLSVLLSVPTGRERPVERALLLSREAVA
jgi:hypothetical protein